MSGDSFLPAGSATGIRTPEPIRAVHAPGENESFVKDTGIQTTVQRPPVQIPANERFTSLVDMPPVRANEFGRRETVNPEPWDQYKAANAHRKLLRHEAESATKVYAVVDSMMAGLMLSEGERLRMRSALATHFFEDVTSFSLEMCYGVLNS